METILLTGAAGRIGTLLREHWRERHRVIGVDVRSYTMLGEHERRLMCGVESLDLEEAFRVAPVGATAVHLAAITSDEGGWDRILRVNIEGTANVFRLAKEYQARRMIFASTNHVTGGYEISSGEGTSRVIYRPPAERITPSTPPKPDSFYAVSKQYGEAMSSFHAHAYGLPTICLRLGSVTHLDDPTEDPRLRYTWLSHRDCCHLFDCCLTARIRFGIYYGVSRNHHRFWDITNAEREITYYPADDAEDHYREGGRRRGIATGSETGL